MEKWKKDTIVYQIYPKSFYDSNGDGCGDLEGIIEKIPYLKSLGINMVWLSPIYMSPMADNGYDISDYQAIHPMFGNLAIFKQLVSQLHQNDIKIMMDLVLNHSSDEHPWFKESLSSKKTPEDDFYIWRDGRKGNRKAPNNWTSFFTGKAWSYKAEREQYYLHLFGSKQPDLNWDNKNVRKALYKMVNFWAESGVDGFRLDVINLISKKAGLPNGRRRLALTGKEHYMNGPKVHQFIKEFHQEVLAKHTLITVGETVFVSPEEALKYCHQNNDELDMVFHFDHMNVDSFNNKWFIMPFKPKKLKKILYKWQNKLYPDGWNALYFENHDQPRSVSRFGNTEEYYERSAKMLATILYLQRGTPYIYQGQEIGMQNASFENLSQYRDIETLNVYDIGRNKLHFTHERMMKKIKYMSRDNARTPMQWNHQVHAGFTKSEPWIETNPNYRDINVEKQEKDPNSILNYYRTLLSVRKAYPVIVEGDFIPYFINHKSLYFYTRNTKDDTLIVMANHSGKAVEFDLPDTVFEENYNHILTNTIPKKLSKKMTLDAFECHVYIASKKEVKRA